MGKEQQKRDKKKKAKQHSPSSEKVEEVKEKTSSLIRDTIEFILCVASIYVVYIYYGVLHEKISKGRYGPDKVKFEHGFFLTSAQCLVSALWGLLLLFLTGQINNVDNTPKQKYVKVSLSYMGAMAASASSLQYISFPVQALAKSCKLIPVMIGRIVMGGASFDLRETIHVLLITSGIAIYFLNDTGSQAAGPSNSWLGAGLLVLSLLLDAYTGPAQESINHGYHPPVFMMMFWINFPPVVLNFSYLFVTGQLTTAYNFCLENPACAFDIALYCLLAAVGQTVILWGVARFNPLTMTIVTTVRKFLSILVSVFWYQHILNGTQWFSICLVFAGITLDTVYKVQLKKSHKHGGKSHKHDRDVSKEQNGNDEKDAGKSAPQTTSAAGAVENSTNSGKSKSKAKKEENVSVNTSSKGKKEQKPESLAQKKRK